MRCKPRVKLGLGKRGLFAEKLAAWATYLTRGKTDDGRYTAR